MQWFLLYAIWKRRSYSADLMVFGFDPQLCRTWRYVKSSKGYEKKNLEETKFVDFSKEFHSIHRWSKLSNIWYLTRNCCTQEKLCKNTKAIVCSPYGDNDLFDIVIWILLGNTIVPYLFMLCLEYVPRISIDLVKEEGFTLKKSKCRRYPAKPIREIG